MKTVRHCGLDPQSPRLATFPHSVVFARSAAFVMPPSITVEFEIRQKTRGCLKSPSFRA